MFPKNIKKVLIMSAIILLFFTAATNALRLKFSKLQPFSIPNSTYVNNPTGVESDNKLVLFNTQNNNLYDIYSQDTEISVINQNNHVYLVTKEFNKGSAGGANYQIYRLNDNTLTEISSGSIFSCRDPIRIKNQLIFKNYGTHCDWLDTGSGKPEKITISL